MLERRHLDVATMSKLESYVCRLVANSCLNFDGISG